MRRDCDVVVVGAGIVGAACAYALRQAGRKVTVLEASYPGTGATAACMGHVVVMDDSEAQMQLTAFSRGEWEKLAPELSPDCEDQNVGTLWVAADGEEMQAAERKAAYYARWGVEAEVLNAAGLYDKAPNLRSGLQGALWVPGDRAVYATRCASWFLRGMETVSGITVAALEETGARCANGDFYAAEIVVLACGTESKRLLPELPLEPRKGHLCITDRYPGFCRHQIVELGYLKSAHGLSAESTAFNVQPRPNGQLLIGSSREFVGWDRAINPVLLAQMLARAFEYMPGLRAMNLLRCWVGFRPATPDKLPLIGAWPGRPGLYVAAGHEGLGITTCLGTARLLAAEILGQAPPFDPRPFHPARAVKEKAEAHG